MASNRRAVFRRPFLSKGDITHVHRETNDLRDAAGRLWDLTDTRGLYKSKAVPGTIEEIVTDLRSMAPHMRMLAKCERLEFLSNAGRRSTLSGCFDLRNRFGPNRLSKHRQDDGGEDEAHKVVLSI